MSQHSNTGREQGQVRRMAMAGSLVGLLACLPAGLPPRADDAVFPPGSHVGLVPPDGMSISPHFTGFMNQTNGASIMISALPVAAYSEIANGFSSEALAPQGLVLTGDCPDAIPAFESRCLRATQQANGQRYQKWLMVVRLEGETSMVVATVPDAALRDGTYSPAEIDTALATLAYTDSLEADPLSILSFTIDEGDLLPFEQTLAGSAAIYAAPEPASTLRPILVVASSVNLQPQAKELAFSRYAFQQIQGLVQPEVSSSQPVAHQELEGHVLEGSATDQETGSDLYVFQVILADDAGKYYRMVGLVPAQDKATYRPEFLRLMETLQPR